MIRTTTRNSGISICLLALFGSIVPYAEAAPPPMTYQGQLKSDGLPVTDTADFRARLWDAPTGGAVVAGFETVTGVNVVNGLFTIELAIDTDPAAVFSGRTKYLELLVAVPSHTELVPLTPRQPITAAPFAAYALDAPGGTVPSPLWQTAGNDIYYNDGFVGVGLTIPTAPLHVTRDLSSGPSIFATSTGSGGTAIYGYGEYSGGTANGVRGETDSENGSGVKGKAWKTTGTAAGVLGRIPVPEWGRRERRKQQRRLGRILSGQDQNHDSVGCRHIDVSHQSRRHRHGGNGRLQVDRGRGHRVCAHE